MQRSGLAAALIGAILLIAGIYLGLASVERDGLVCGQAFGSSQPVPDLSKAQDGIFYSDAHDMSNCRSAVSTRREASLAIAIPGGILVLAGLGVALRRRRSA